MAEARSPIVVRCRCIFPGRLSLLWLPTSGTGWIVGPFFATINANPARVLVS